MRKLTRNVMVAFTTQRNKIWGQHLKKLNYLGDGA